MIHECWQDGLFDELYTPPGGHFQSLLIPMLRKSDSGKENRKREPEKWAGKSDKEKVNWKSEHEKVNLRDWNRSLVWAII